MQSHSDNRLLLRNHGGQHLEARFVVRMVLVKQKNAIMQQKMDVVCKWNWVNVLVFAFASIAKNSNRFAIVIQ